MIKAPSSVDVAVASKPDSDRREQIEKVSEQFEAIFLELVFKSMRETVPEGQLIERGFGEGVFSSMLDREYAGSMASSQSVGLARLIANQLDGLQESGKKARQISNEITGKNLYLRGGLYSPKEKMTME